MKSMGAFIQKAPIEQHDIFPFVVIAEKRPCL